MTYCLYDAFKLRHRVDKLQALISATNNLISNAKQTYSFQNFNNVLTALSRSHVMHNSDSLEADDALCRNVSAANQESAHLRDATSNYFPILTCVSKVIPPTIWLGDEPRVAHQKNSEINHRRKVFRARFLKFSQLRVGSEFFRGIKSNEWPSMRSSFLTRTSFFHT